MKHIIPSLGLTMSSREIADLCEKDHKNVKRDVEAMCSGLEINALTFERIYKDSRNRDQTEYYLPKDLTLTLVAGYNVKLRKRIIDRWMELESNVAKFEIPQTFAEALRLAAEQTEKLEKQAVVIAEMQPKAEFHDDVAVAVNAQDYQAVAKVFGTGRTRFTRWLKAKKITMENLRPYQQYEDAGYFRVVERKRKDPITGESIIYTKTLITGKGVIYLQKKWNEDNGLGGNV